MIATHGQLDDCNMGTFCFLAGDNLLGPPMPFKLFKQIMLVATKKRLTKKKNVVHNMHNNATP